MDSLRDKCEFIKKKCRSRFKGQGGHDVPPVLISFFQRLTKYRLNIGCTKMRYSAPEERSHSKESPVYLQA